MAVKVTEKLRGAPRRAKPLTMADKRRRRGGGVGGKIVGGLRRKVRGGPKLGKLFGGGRR